MLLASAVCCELLLSVVSFCSLFVFLCFVCVFAGILQSDVRSCVPCKNGYIKRGLLVGYSEGVAFGSALARAPLGLNFRVLLGSGTDGGRGGQAVPLETVWS